MSRSAQPFDSIAAVGDVADVNAWSGIPWHFWQTAQRLEWSVEPWRLDLGEFEMRRRMWNIGQLLRGRGRGGFQYSPAFLDAAERQIPERLFSGRVLTFNQHFPRASSVARHGGTLIHYIDAPFAALVQGRGLELRLPRWICERALALERENFAASERVICMARWAADAVVELCGVPRSKVSVVLPGANLELPDDFAFRTSRGKPGVDRPFVLGFVGKDWQRKGLPFLLEVADELVRLGVQTEVHAIGFDPERGLQHPRLRALGFIDKAHDVRAFVQFLEECDLGCLFSTHEALGISTLEFLRVGVPVAGFAQEGMADTLLEGASLRFQPNVGSKEVARTIAEMFRDGTQVTQLRAFAATSSGRVTWDRAVREIMNAISCNRVGLRSRN